MRLDIPLLLLLASSGRLLAQPMPPPGATSAECTQQLPHLLELYRHLHANPELSLHEQETSNRIGAELRAAGAKVTENVGGFGVVGLIENGLGPTLLIRADMDALPVTEQTGLPHASIVKANDADGNPVGVMHACGHDVHMACLVGSARWLSEHRDRWQGTILLIGQPAEERVAGAAKMLADGLYTRFPRPDAAIALHVANDLETGKVAYTSGPALASATSVDVHVRGRGGHGAGPHLTVDPIVLASLLVLDLQTIVSREIKPLDPAVVTVGAFHGGTKHNIIPDEVHLQLTIRSFKPEVRQQLIEGIERRAKALAVAHRAPEPKVVVGESTPPTVNSPELVAKVVPFLAATLGETAVETVEPAMGAEDFGLFGKDGIPVFMFRLGTVSPERLAGFRSEGREPPSLHSAYYFPDTEASILTGVRALTAAACGLLPP